MKDVLRINLTVANTKKKKSREIDLIGLFHEYDTLW